jgi:cystathionine beta-lyase
MAILSLTEAELRTRRSLKWRTYHPDVLPLWVAEMDVAMHPAVEAELLAAARRGDTGYPHGRAYADAFRAIAADRWDLILDDRQVVTAGDVMNAILAVLTEVTAPGDRVVINPPIYPPFRQVVAGYGREIVEVPLRADGRLDLDALEAALATRPAAYLLCSPHNPNGTVHTAAELAAVVAACAAHDVQLIVDEIHAPLVDPGVVFTPALAVPGSERVIVVTSAGKAWNLAAFKAGLIVGGSGAADVLAGLPPLARQSTGHFGAMLHATALLEAQDWVDELMVEVAANKRLLATLLAERVPGVEYVPAEGTYLAWVDCTGLGLADPVGHFLEHGRVAFSAGRNFGSDHAQWARINLAASPGLVTDAVDRMAAALSR